MNLPTGPAPFHLPSTPSTPVAFDAAWLASLKCQLLDDCVELSRWTAQDASCGRSWLIMRPTARSTLWALSRLDREYGIGPRLQRDWAVIPLVYLKTPDGPVLVFDDDNGAPLSSQIMGPSCSVERFLSLAIEMSAAIAQAHRHGLIHGDIRPQNFILASNSRVRLTGFAFAIANGEQQGEGLPRSDSSLPYLAPEATDVSHPDSPLTDIYALGVSLYELMTGHLPFKAQDTVQWLHQHRAVLPPSISALRPEAPAALCDLLAALLAKQPDQRPATADAVEAELRRCLYEWQDGGCIRRSGSQFHKPSGPLVGRVDELASLRSAQARLAHGHSGVVLIHGEAGIGKTSLVQQWRQALEGTAIRFAGGKCELSRHQLPYAALSTALGSLFAGLASAAHDDISQLRTRLRTAVGDNGAMLARVVPELEWITDTLPALDNRPPVSEARQHLHGMIQRVLAAVCTKRQPLVLFLDDVQWLDDESHHFISELVANLNHVLLILAFRSDHGSGDSNLGRLVTRCRTITSGVLDIRLEPLAQPHVDELLSRELVLHPQEHRLLADRISRRGDANPLYLMQCVAMLRDSASPSEAANLMPHMNDVAALLESRLQRLPAATRETLCTLAILGNPTSLDSLALVCRQSTAETVSQLRPALKAGLVVEHREGFSFTHDSVWESTLAHIPLAEEARMRTESASLLLATLREDSPPEAVFWVAGHIVRAADRWVDEQREAYVDLLIRAARLAMGAAAVQTALEYLEQAERMAPAGDRQSHLVALLLTRCWIQSANFAAADQRILQLLACTDDPVACAELYHLRCEVHSLRGDYRGAIDTAIEGLALFGTTVPRYPSGKEAEAAWADLQSALAGRPPSEFSRLTPVLDPNVQAVLELLAAIAGPGSFIQPNLMLLACSRIALLTLHNGMSSAGVLGLAWLGVVIADRFDLYHEGLAYTTTARMIADQPGYTGNLTAVLVALDQVSAWTQPLPFSLECAEAAYHASIEQGSPTFACYANNHIVSDLLVLGAPIERMLGHIDAGLRTAQNLEFQDAQTILHVQARYIRRLSGKNLVSVPIPPDDELARRVAGSQMGQLHFWWSLFEGLLQLLDGHLEQAAVHLDATWDLTWAVPAHVHLIDLALFTVINRAGLQTSTGRQQSFEQPMRLLRLWAHLNPRYFADRLALAEAEMLRIEDRPLEALQRYQEAIDKAEQCGAIHILGLAHELAARCNEALALRSNAQHHFRQAHDAWLKWGATALAGHLEAEHPYLCRSTEGVAAARSVPGDAQLAILTITRACQALSREIEPDKLVRTLLANATMHAGATYAALLLRNESGLTVEAVSVVEGDDISVALRPGAPPAEAAPLSLVLRVMGSGEPLLTDGREAFRRFGEDRYLAKVENGSLLCLPLIKQNSVIGVLYLENGLTPCVFEPAGVDVLKLLAAQAAISLSTARLYTDLLAENQRRRESEDTLQRTQALLAIGQEVSRYGTFVWKYQSAPSFWTHTLLIELGLCEQNTGDYRHAATVLVHAEDRARFDQVLKNAVERFDAFRLEFRTVSLDGAVRHLELVGEPDGTDAFIGVVLDITERRQTETALRAARAEMDRTSQATVLGELAASIAHEINQPLASILSNAGASIRWLTRTTPEIGEALEGLLDIQAEGQRAADIVRATRALARQAPLERKPIALDQLIRAVLAVSQADLDDRHIGVMLQFGGGTSGAYVEGDATQLQQVVRNLIINAAESMQAIPPRTRQMEIQTAIAGSEMLVFVKDSGPGVPSDKQGKIFDPFFSTKATGMGMGLAICASIIAAHGGRLGFTQGRQNESIFYFLLPLKRMAR